MTWYILRFVMNKSFKWVWFLMWLLAVQVVGASPVKTSKQQNAINLAMLDLSRLEVVGREKTSKPKSAEIFPQDCLTWSAAQINRKSHEFKQHINTYSRKYKIDSNLVKAVITAESCFKKKALSHKGAKGLMQLIPDTAKRFGVKNSYDPKQNIRGGIRYLRFLTDRFKGDLKKIIAGYNAGEGKVDRYKGIPPYKETKQYVKNVLKTYNLLSPKRVHAVYYPPRLGLKPGRSGWQYNRAQAPHLYKR